ncbi:hypothetical protein O181_054280 [Austropuccinia psidii MF-1]|uniref:Uncharacterized protein n=1 Tax=Austropuccinia psidii MF-1 TaxID=1389203 RepID=A0A9Q3E8I0_9BASI|nr:hypothetical protein [Austropuccinia psidii MF-1]
MSPEYLRDLGFQGNQPEDREGLNHTHTAIDIPIQQEPQTRGLERHGSSPSAPPTPQRFISMEHQQQEVKPGISLGITWSKLPEYLSQQDRLQRPYGNHQRLESHQAVQTPGDRAHSYSFRLTRRRPNCLPCGFTPFRNQPISGEESPFFTLPGGLQEKTRTQGQEQDLFSPKAERVRPNDPETVGIGERSTQEQEVVVNHSRINSLLNRNITPTQIEHNAVSPESNLKGDTLWLQRSQYAEQTQKQFSELEASHESIKKSTASMDKIVKTLQEGHAQLSKSSEETNKILNIVFEEQHHSRRDRDYLHQAMNKLCNVYHNMKPNHKATLWIIHITKLTSNQIPCWLIRQDLHHNTRMEIKCLLLKRKP